jgi:SAM-dependent methyltransferase
VGHEQTNRATWNADADHYQATNAAQIMGQAFSGDIAWGLWGIPESELHVLGDVDGKDVLELGCGSGLLTRRLLGAGHRVVATDASPAMLALARGVAGDAEEIRRLTLPDDPIPAADAIVSVGHVLDYLPDAAAIERALVAIAAALERVRWFRLEPERLYFIDNTRGFGHRDEIRLVDGTLLGRA